MNHLARTNIHIRRKGDGIVILVEDLPVQNVKVTINNTYMTELGNLDVGEHSFPGSVLFAQRGQDQEIPIIHKIWLTGNVGKEPIRIEQVCVRSVGPTRRDR